MTSIEQLEFLGRGYAGLGAAASAIVGALMIYSGYKKIDTDPERNSLIYGGIAIIVTGVTLWVLASKYDSIAAISGIWLGVSIIAAVAAIIKNPTI